MGKMTISTGWFFSLVPPDFSTINKNVNQPITAAVQVNPVTKKGRDWLLGGFLFGTEIVGYQGGKHPVYFLCHLQVLGILVSFSLSRQIDKRQFSKKVQKPKLCQ